MPHVQLENIALSYPEGDVLRDISWRIDENSKIGLVGRNGIGKTTLLDIAAGEKAPDNGVVYRSKDLKIGYLRQYYGPRGNKTMQAYLKEAFSQLSSIQEELAGLEQILAANDAAKESLERYGKLQELYELQDGYSFEARLQAVVQGLGFVASDLGKPLEQFSGGEANRVALARILLENPNLLLLDEPTNHLDIEAMEWLEQYLKEFKGGVVMVTHDRYFLDKTITQIAELRLGELEFFYGNYSAYITEKAERRVRAEKAFRLQEEFIKNTEDFIHRTIANQKNKQAKSRMKMLDKLERLEKPVGEQRSMAVSFDTDHFGGQILAEGEGISIFFGERHVLKQVDFQLKRGDKIGLIGANGSGKSTLLHIMRGVLPPSDGEISLGYKVKLGYYDQQLRDIDQEKNVLDDFLKVYPGLTYFEARSFLGRFLFSGDEVYKSAAVLSGGETARLALAKLMFSRPNLMLLDEPTNHLDVSGREMLEAALQEFGGTIVLVSHDRYLLDRVVNKIWLILDGCLHEYLGNYSDFRESRRRELDYAATQEKTPTAPDGAKSDRRVSKRELRKQRAQEREQFGPPAAKLEQEIAEQEHLLQDVQLQINDGRHGANWEILVELHQQEQSLKTEINRLLALWEEAAAREMEEEQL